MGTSQKIWFCSLRIPKSICRQYRFFGELEIVEAVRACRADTITAHGGVTSRVLKVTYCSVGIWAFNQMSSNFLTHFIIASSTCAFFLFAAKSMLSKSQR